MNKNFLLTFAAALMMLPASPNVFSAETNVAETSASDGGTNAPMPAILADLKEIVSRINEKLKLDKTNEADLADNLKEFDAILAKNKDAKPDDRVEVLLKKMELYLQVLNDPEKGLAVIKQIKTDYPTVQINGNTDDVVNSLQAVVDKKKLSGALVPGAPFPDFNEKDVNGQPLSISKFKGKVVLVDFWATWCMPCVVKLPEIQKAYDKFHDQGFEVVGISLDEEKDRLQQFTKQRKMPWPEFFDGKRWENKLAVKYGVDSTPTGYLIGRDGKIITKLSGSEDLEVAVAQALKN